MLDLVLKAVRSLFNKCEKMISDAVEESKSPYWENVQDKPFESNLRTGELLNALVHFGDSQLTEMVNTSNNTPVLNEMYTVNWNGTDYECMAVQPDYGGIIAITLGNLAMLGIEPINDANEPFLIVFATKPNEDGKLAISFLKSDEPTTALVTINGLFGELKLLDEQYLQESAKSALYIWCDPFSNSGESHLQNTGDYYKILTAVRVGRTVYLGFGNNELARAVFVGNSMFYNSHLVFIGVAGGYENGVEKRVLYTYEVHPDGKIYRYEV